MSGTELALPDNIALPAHLMTAEAAAAIAAANAAAGGGIKTGGFPRVSIKGGKFHLVKGGETHTILNPPESPGAPPLPKMLLQVVVVAANPAIVKTYYPGKFQDGDDGEPACSSDNGVTPDSHIAAPQGSACATCPQNAWGSKISEASGKEIKACSDSKRLVILPAENLDYEAYALSVTASALTAWGKYVKALSDKKIPINAVVTNVMFDSTASYPRLVFSFGRLLTADEYAKVTKRVAGDDVQNIVSPVRSISVAVPLLPSQVAAATAEVAQPVSRTTGAAATTVPPVAAAPVVTGFGAPAAPVAPVPPPAEAPTVTETPKRTRAPRAKAADADPNFAGLPAHVEPACKGAGAPGSPAFNATFKALAGKDYVVAAEGTLGSGVIQAGSTPAPAAAAPTQPATGFGVAHPAPPAEVPAATPSQVAGANDLAAKLKAKLAALKAG